MEYVEIALSLVFTAAVYCAFPLLFAFLRKSPIAKKKYRFLCIIVTASVAIVFQILRIASDLSGNAFVPALLWGAVFYNFGLSILRKRKMLSGTIPPQQPPEPAVVTPSPDASPAPAKPTPPPPITETWYTCPSCGCLSRTGEICACGYHPPKAAAAAPARRKWPIIAVAVLAVALACSLFYNVEQKNMIKLKDSAIETRQSIIDRYESKIATLSEYNNYLIEDLEHLCDPLYTDFESTKFRHDVRNSSNPFVRPQPSEENVFYWMLMALRNKNGELDY